MSNDFIDLWIDIQDRSVKPVCRLKAASEHIWLKSHKKQKFELQSRMNVERLLVYIDHWLSLIVEKEPENICENSESYIISGSV